MVLRSRVSISTAAPLVLAFLMGLSSGTVSSAAEPTLISIDDLYRLDSPQNPLILPQQTGVIYSRRWSDRPTRTVRYALWRVNADGRPPRAMEEGQPDARQPILSADGKWVAFLSTRPGVDGKPVSRAIAPSSDPAMDIWLISTAGGPAIPLVSPEKKPYGCVFGDPFYGNISFSPDGKRLVFVADDGRDVRTPAEIRNNVRVVREDQGEGYEGYRPAQIWIADLLEQPTDVAASKVTRVTNDETWYGDPQWLPDGDALVVHANRTAERESVRYSINQDYDLWRIDLKDLSVRPLTSGPGPEVSPRISPDGRQLVYLTNPRRGSHMDAFSLSVITLDSTAEQPRVIFDQHSPEAQQPPHLPPAFPLPCDCWLSADQVYFNVADRTVNRTEVIDLSVGPKALTDANPEAHNSERAAQGELLRKLLPPADSFLSERIVAKGEVITWKSSDGLEIEGIFTRPTLPGSRAPYKMVLVPHGGPHGRVTLGFDMTVQVLAAHGYAVFQPNFRGSTGYGQKFIDADRFDFGGGDADDCLTGITALVRQGLVDPRRQFVYGSSYGGYMTTWLIGQTHQFRAAAPLNPVTDLTMMWGLTDIQSWTEWEFGGRPWEVPELMRERSPLTYASRVKTPTLILHAANDRRCPLPMSRAYYRTLQRSGVEVEMVVYPDEGHPIKQLPHLEDVLTRVLDWFAKHDVAAAP